MAGFPVGFHACIIAPKAWERQVVRIGKTPAMPRRGPMLFTTVTHTRETTLLLGEEAWSAGIREVGFQHRPR